MKLTFGFGTGTQTAELPEKNVLGVLHANPVTPALTGEAEVRRALGEPIGAPLLKEAVHPGEKVAIVTSDITRPMPTYAVLPPLLDALYEAGIRREDITLVFALGSHRKHTEEEKKKLAGARAYEEISCVDGDSGDCVHMGVTSRGTPVDIVRMVAEADRKICLGNVEYHYFAGYSGGAKAIMPGVSTREAIQCNHSRMVLPEACAGRLDGNPVREDIEEAGAICGIDYIINVVLDEHKKIIFAAAGDAVKAHREACRFLDGIYRKEIPQKADIVLVSQGGAPKDLNLYQTQKALENAKYAVRKGGIIILIGSCKEVLGEWVFEEWMTGSKAPGDMVERIQKDFQLGGHKAASIAMVLENARIFLVSELPEDYVRNIFLEPKASVQEALDCAFEELGRDAAVLAMPYGGSTLPCIAEKQEVTEIQDRRKSMEREMREKLEELAVRIRIGALESIKSRGFGHIGGALSVCDALAVLYGSQMRVEPKNPRRPERDKLVCSKGHAGPAVYAALALKGFYPYDEIKTLNQPGTRFPSHCDWKKTPGVDMTTGSLGQGTSLAVGIALGDKLRGRDCRTFLIVGDGELNEGQCWEAFQFAAGKNLGNLVVLVDWNKKQLDGYTSDVLRNEALADKMSAFGFCTRSICGNDVGELYEALEETRQGGEKPYAIVMDTVKGKGVREIEETMSNHSMTADGETFDRWLGELYPRLEAGA